MKRETRAVFTPEEERALSTLQDDYRLLTAGRGRQAPSGRLRSFLPSGVKRRLSAGLLGLCLACAAAVPFSAGPLRLRPSVSSLPTALPDIPADRSLPAAADSGGQICVNTAGADQLVLLPGVGPVLAERMIAEREKNGPFRLPEDLLAVRGVGPAMLRSILPMISLETPPPAEPAETGEE